MNLPNIITASRIVFSPVFFAVYFLPEWTGIGRAVPIVLLWLLFGLIEVSDLIDGKIARRTQTVSDLGKILDPFADSLSRLTYFFCFTVGGLMYPWIFLLVLYRDLGVSFIRILVSRSGVAMPARLSGKIKAWVYAVSGFGGLAYLTLSEFFPGSYLGTALVVLKAVFVITALTAVWTLIDYTEPLIRGSRKPS